jgi:hypothetical protein
MLEKVIQPDGEGGCCYSACICIPHHKCVSTFFAMHYAKFFMQPSFFQDGRDLEMLVHLGKLFSSYMFL